MSVFQDRTAALDEGFDCLERGDLDAFDAFLFFASFEMKGAASGIPMQTEVGQLFELEDGLFKRGTSYTSHAEARAAAAALEAAT